MNLSCVLAPSFRIVHKKKETQDINIVEDINEDPVFVLTFYLFMKGMERFISMKTMFWRQSYFCT